MAFDFSEQDLVRMLDAGDEEKYWAIFEPRPTWLDEETPAMSERGWAKQRRARRFRVLEERVNLDENCPDFAKYFASKKFWKRFDNKAVRRAAQDVLAADLREWERRFEHEAWDYFHEEDRILEDEIAHGDGSWVQWTPSNNPCWNDAIAAKLYAALAA